MFKLIARQKAARSTHTVHFPSMFTILNDPLPNPLQSHLKMEEVFGSDFRHKRTYSIEGNRVIETNRRDKRTLKFKSSKFLKVNYETVLLYVYTFFLSSETVVWWERDGGSCGRASVVTI